MFLTAKGKKDTVYFKLLVWLMSYLKSLGGPTGHDLYCSTPPEGSQVCLASVLRSSHATSLHHCFSVLIILTEGQIEVTSSVSMLANISLTGYNVWPGSTISRCLIHWLIWFDPESPDIIATFEPLTFTRTGATRLPVAREVSGQIFLACSAYQILWV